MVECSTWNVRMKKSDVPCGTSERRTKQKEQCSMWNIALSIFRRMDQERFGTVMVRRVKVFFSSRAHFTAMPLRFMVATALSMLL